MMRSTTILLILSVLKLAHTFTSRPAFFFSSRQYQAMLRVAQQDQFDMEELRQRIEEESFPHLFEQPPSSTSTVRPRNPQQAVYVILFNPGTHDQGAHTIEYPKGSGNNVILAFENSQACDKFAQSLKKQNFIDPTPQEFKLNELKLVCDALGVFVQVVPNGVELIPPTENVKTFGHDPSLKESKKYLDYIFAMDDAEVEETGLLLDDDDDDDDDDDEVNVGYLSSTMSGEGASFGNGAWE